MPLFSASADRNKEPILEVISSTLENSQHVLEIGSGTGQHAVYFAEQMPHLRWQPTDFGDYLPDLNAYIQASSIGNLASPIELDVRNFPWGQLDHLKAPVDTVFTANTLHIMGWEAVESFFTGVEQILQSAGHLIVYGPFKYSGDFTTPSNADFDLWLKDRDPVSGVRDFEAVDALAREIGLLLEQDHAMPANNQCLIWQRK